MIKAIISLIVAMFACPDIYCDGAVKIWPSRPRMQKVKEELNSKSTETREPGMAPACPKGAKE